MNATEQEQVILARVIEASRILGEIKRQLHDLVNAAYQEGFREGNAQALPEERTEERH